MSPCYQTRGISDALYSAIKGKGAFRRFKDSIIRVDIEDNWYKYREEAIKQVAIYWCQLNQIDFKDKQNALRGGALQWDILAATLKDDYREGFQLLYS